MKQVSKPDTYNLCRDIDQKVALNSMPKNVQKSKIIAMSNVLAEPLSKKPKMATVSTPPPTTNDDSNILNTVDPNIQQLGNPNVEVIPFDINDTDDNALIKFLNSNEI